MISLYWNMISRVMYLTALKCVYQMYIFLLSLLTHTALAIPMNLHLKPVKFTFGGPVVPLEKGKSATSCLVSTSTPVLAGAEARKSLKDMPFASDGLWGSFLFSTSMYRMVFTPLAHWDRAAFTCQFGIGIGG